MPHSRHVPSARAEALSFWLLAGFLVILWIAGGASRPDVAGQALTRAAAWSIAVAIVALNLRPQLSQVRIPAILLGIAVLLPALQLVPLPPAIWTELPGRAVLLAGEALTGETGLWRPISISPGWTRNALGSLIVPVVCLALVAGVSRRHDLLLLRLLLALIAAGSLLALLQFAGRPVDHPLINDVAGQVSGNFANRNHLALFASAGCLLAPVWAARDHAFRNWGVLFAAAMVTLFLLVILATGSRAGIVLGTLGTVAGVWAGFAHIRRAVRALPPRITAIAVAGVLGVLASVIAASVLLGRAAGVDRAFELSAQDDARIKALPTVIELLREYFPFGSGFGTFDPAFRIHEGNDLLGPTYFNQAHNDLLQVGIGGGLAGFALLGAALVWWFTRSIGAWTRPDAIMRRTGSAAILLVIVGSAIDYPARTPMIMALLMVAAWWLGRPERTQDEPPARSA